MTSSPPALTRIRIGSAPDSWGVWFPDDPLQTPWERFLDEVADSGYEWIELGPYGYLPTDPARLTEETAGRGLRVSAGTVFTGLHHGPAVWAQTWEHVSRIAALTQAMGAGHLVVIPSFWRDDKTGKVLEDRTLTPEQWRELTTQTERLGREVRDRYGLRIVVHPHADTHIDTPENVARFLDATDPNLVSLCLDTGHYAYCGGDSVQAIETFAERIGYLHLKQVDPRILAEVLAEELLLRAGRRPRGDVRTSVGGARAGARPRGRPAARCGPVRHRGAGHVPVPARPAAADRPPYPRLPALLRRPLTPRREHDMSTLGIAVIGTGKMGADHVRRIGRTVGGARVVAVADPDGDRVKAVAAGLDGASAHTDPAAAMAAPESRPY